MVSTTTTAAERKTKMLEQVVIIGMIPLGIVFGVLTHLFTRKEIDE